MKSKLRKILVDDVAYKTNVVVVSPNFLCLRIWLSENRSMPWAQIRYRFDDPWLYFPEMTRLEASGKDTSEHFHEKPITPKMVAELIRMVTKMEGSPSVLKRSLNYELADDGVLSTIPNALAV